MERRTTTALEGLQVFAWLKWNGLSGGNVHLGSGTRISANAGFSRLHREHAEPTQFNSIVGFQGILHTVEDRIHRLLGFSLADACSFNDLIDKIQLDHGQPPQI